ncbi:AraC family transcriptional regulator [Thomasclavelia ramosa]|nr:AraC family transcriptional regulator [Thomasclavelia ramosa]MBV4086425.1 AraC family transcriptional regulator [Thomasclavelia ramosa]
MFTTIAQEIGYLKYHLYRMFTTIAQEIGYLKYHLYRMFTMIAGITIYQ